MEVSIVNSNDVMGLNKFIGDNIEIINIKFRDDLHFVQMSSENEVFRAFSNSRKGAISNTLKAIKRVH